jgi:hypothetical protein
MRIARSQEKDGTIAPSAVNYLGEIPAAYVFLNQHARRHPLAIYNVSLHQLADHVSQLLNQYFETHRHIEEKGDAPGEGEHYARLLGAQGRLIHSLREHVDDCYLILACLVDPAGVPPKAAKKRFTEQWLEAAGFPTLGSFGQSIVEYRHGYLSPLVNGLKHKQCRLRGVFFHKRLDVRLGYYLEEPDADGVPGPSLAVHKDGNSAFSFARDILFNLYHVYYISEMLIEAVKGALRQYHSFSLKPRTAEPENEGWVNLLRQAAKIRPSVFPDEVDKPFPYFTFIEGEKAEAVLMYPVTMIPLSFPPGMRISGIFIGDGVTQTFKLPYVKWSKYGGVR